MGTSCLTLCIITQSAFLFFTVSIPKKEKTTIYTTLVKALLPSQEAVSNALSSGTVPLLLPP